MISIELAGRLGNHLFQYAAGRAFAERNGFKFCVPRPQSPCPDSDHVKSWLGGELFSCDLGERYRRAWRTFREQNDAYTEIPVRSRQHLVGYWQSPRYFDDHAEQVRAWFAMPRTVPTHPDQCVIHFRARDAYAEPDHLLPKTYFNRAIATIRAVRPSAEFTVVTDNLDLARAYFPEFSVQQNTPRVDFELIQRAPFKIICASSFSWWAAWLGLPQSHLVIAPQRWLNHNFNRSPQDEFYPRDIVTPGFQYL